jgi:predicted kinase
MCAATFDTMQIVLVCGNYASGKSILAAKYFPNFKRVNHGEIRRFIRTMTEHGRAWTARDYDSEMENLVKRIETAIINYYLERKAHVIVDNTCINKESRKKYIQEAKMRKLSIGCVFIDVAAEELIRRNRARPEGTRVPENVISMLAAKTELPTTGEGFNLVRIVRDKS